MSKRQQRGGTYQRQMKELAERLVPVFQPFRLAVDPRLQNAPRDQVDHDADDADHGEVDLPDFLQPLHHKIAGEGRCHDSDQDGNPTPCG